MCTYVYIEKSDESFSPVVGEWEYFGDWVESAVERRNDLQLLLQHAVI